MFKIASVSGAPRSGGSLLGSLRCSPRPPSCEGFLAFGNRIFAPSALNPHLAPPKQKYPPVNPPKQKYPPVSPQTQNPRTANGRWVVGFGWSSVEQIFNGPSTI